MRLLQHISEGRSKSIDVYEAIERIKVECSAAYKAHQNGRMVYRGIESGGNDDAFFINPTSGTRKSKDGPNAYTLLIDNSPRWSKYPKRSRSIICTTSWRTASGFGNVYRVFAKDGSNFGIVPEMDIWWGFKDEMITHLADVYNGVSRLFKLPVITDKSPSTYSVMVGMFKNFDKYWKDNNLDYLLKDTFGSSDKLKVSFNIHQRQSSWKDNWMVKHYKGDMLKAWEEFADPTRNGFRHVIGQDKVFAAASPVGSEVWTDGDAYMIRDDIGAYVGLK